jgi:hypothetical protein
MRYVATSLREPIISGIPQKNLEKKKKEQGACPALKIVSTLFPRKDWI